MLRLSREAFALGARPAIVMRLTGITEAEIARVFISAKEARASIGGAPTSPAWATRRTLNNLHLVYFYQRFTLLRARGNRSPESFIAAYAFYRARFAHAPRLSFDRAFYLVGQIDGTWAKARPQLEALACRSCGCLQIRLIGENPLAPCALCDLERHYRDGGKIRQALSAPLFELLDDLRMGARQPIGGKLH
jgi:hypothetical protein